MTDVDDLRATYVREQLDDTLKKILRKSVKLDEFAWELHKEHLDSQELVKDVSINSSVRAQVLAEYQPVLDQEQEVKFHARAAPPFWQRGWRPRRQQIVGLVAMALIPLVDIWFFFTYLIDLSSILKILSIFFILGTAGLWAAVAEYSLPATTWDWQEWCRKYINLLLRVPEKKREWQQAIREEIVYPYIREWINSKKKPSYSTDLTLRDTSALALPSNETPLVKTTSMRKFLKEVGRIDPGAIGVAGRRGVGKTTLIERMIANDFTPMLSPPFLTVMASAPVRYDARDFVLHLYAATCRAVLETATGRRDGLSDVVGDEQWLRLARRERQKAAAGRGVRSILFGFLLFGIGISLAYLSWPASVKLPTDRIGDQFFSGYLRMVSHPLDYIKPWRWPILLEVGSFAFIALGLVRLTWRALLIVKALIIWMLLFFTRKLDLPVLSSDRKALYRLARQHLRRVRFLQTRTEGWSGKFGSSGGFEFGLNRSVASAEQPLTHPEIVHEYRAFIERVVSVMVPHELSGVVVAIDELDKISDAAQAREFINEIKGIFGVPRCLFLVSVSEDALSAFARRGIPVRDEFDSAFSTMVHVEPFGLNESRSWLARRAIGIPEPFIHLCHCLSGGLPRDLRRTAIAMLDIKSSNATPSLELVTRMLVSFELDAKLRAFSSAAQQLNSGEDVSNFLTQLNASTWNTRIPESILSLCADLLPDSPAQVPTALELLKWEASCYLYFSATLLEVFRDNHGSRLQQAALAEIFGGTIYTLATARQHMALDPRVSWRHIAGFRQSWRLSLIDAIETPSPDVTYLHRPPQPT